MTGNTVKLGMSIQVGNWEKCGVYITVLLCFSFGTLLTIIMLGQSVPRQRLWLLLFCVLLVLVDVITFAIRESGGSSTVGAADRGRRPMDRGSWAWPLVC